MIYDHEREADAQRDRPVADWGGDDLFTSMPRRFARHAERRPGRFGGSSGAGSHGGRRGAGAEGHRAPGRTAEHGPSEPGPIGDSPIGHGATGHTAGAQQAAVAARMPHPQALRVADAVTPVPPAPLAAGSESVAPAPLVAGTGVIADVTASGEHTAHQPATPAERRTVTITGRPGAVAAAVRRRPQPTVHDRLGSRPDRIAAWAFGLGITLILIAVGTADAAVI